MNNLKLNNNLYQQENLSFISQFSNGIVYCDCEQQIDLIHGLVRKDNRKTALFFKAKQILSIWKKLIINYYDRQINDRENKLTEKSQLLLQNLSYDAAWTSSLVAVASLGITLEIANTWSDNDQNLTSELPSIDFPLLFNSSKSNRLANRLFPLLEIEEIELVTFGKKLVNQATSIPLAAISNFGQLNNFKIDNWDNKLNFFQPITANKSEMFETQSGGSLMAMPSLPNQASLSGFASFLPTLKLFNSTKDFEINQSNLSQKTDQQLSSSWSGLIPSDLGGKLMAIPEVEYQPYFPKIQFFERYKTVKKD